MFQMVDYAWLHVVSPQHIPSKWLALDLGPGELAVLSLALEHPARVVLLDDRLARRVAIAADLDIWGTLRITLEAKTRGLTDTIKPILSQLQEAGMWISSDVQKRILALADEAE